jgi:hypothetical protein
MKMSTISTEQRAGSNSDGIAAEHSCGIKQATSSAPVLGLPPEQLTSSKEFVSWRYPLIRKSYTTFPSGAW